MKKLDITLLRDKTVSELDLVENYIKQKGFGVTKRDKDFVSFTKKFKDGISLKLQVYQCSDVKDKKSLPGKDFVIIIFDMTNRKSFEDVLDKWVKFLREVKYYNNIILFGTNNPDNKDALPMTDEEEVKSLIDVAEIKGDFYDIGNKNVNEKCDLIDNLIEEAYKDAKENVKQKDCIIY